MGTTPRSYPDHLGGWAALAICTVMAFVAGTPSQASARASGTCAAPGVVVWLNNLSGGAAAGSTYFKLEFTNLSGRACTFRGYPGVSAVDLRGRQLGSPARRNPAHPSRTITLAPGASATALLQIADAYNYPAGRCQRTTAAGLRVALPDQTQVKTVPFPFLACSRTGPTYLAIAPLQHA